MTRKRIRRESPRPSRRHPTRLVEVDKPRGRALPARAVVLDELRALSRRGVNQAHDIRSKRLRAAVLSYFGSFRRARIAAGLPFWTTPVKWTRARLERELQGLHREGVRLTETNLLSLGRSDLLHAANLIAGGIGQARRLARVPEPPSLRRRPPTQWDQTAVIAEIEDRLARGESLARSRVPGYHREAARRHCGSWIAAIEMAGIDPASVRLIRTPRSEQEIVSDLRALARRRPLARPNEINRDSVVLAAKLRFGSLAAACERAGISGWPVRQHQALLDKETTLDAIQARHSRKKTMTAAAVTADDPRLNRAGVRHFGSWELALRAARVPVVRVTTRQRSDEDALAALRARADAGKVMSAKALEADQPSLSTYVQRNLGGFIAAARRAGVSRDRLAREARRRQPLPDKDETLQLLRQRASAGSSVSRHGVRDEAPLLFRAALHHFGSWPRVRRELGGTF
jgi:hypothetical protein